jgi:hypothetical protein
VSSGYVSAFVGSAKTKLHLHSPSNTDEIVKCTSPFFMTTEDGDTANDILQRRAFLSRIGLAALIPSASHAREVVIISSESSNAPFTNKPFHSAAYGQEEYTNSIVASRDTNISPREVYDTISSDYLKGVLDLVKGRSPRALDVGAGE